MTAASNNNNNKLAKEVHEALGVQLKQLALPILLIASIGLMAQASTDYSSGFTQAYTKYGIAVGTISTILVAAVLAVQKFSPGAIDTRGSGFRAMSLFLFVWWGIGAAILTWQTEVESFALVGNAYFCLWFGFIAAASLFHVTVLREKRLDVSSAPPFALGGLFVASLIEFISAAAICSGNTIQKFSVADESCSGTSGFVLSCGVISFAICAALCLMPTLHRHSTMQLIAYFLVAWWTCGVYIGTFGTGKTNEIAIFKLPSNGYFSSWLALGFAASLAFANQPSEQAVGNSAIGQPIDNSEGAPPIAQNV